MSDESNALCCGNHLRRPMVLFGGPMVAGRLDAYAIRDVVSNGTRGATCSTPGCDCGGWVPTPGLTQPEGGDPAHKWFALYVSDLSIGYSEDKPNRIHSCKVEPSQVLAIRHISTPGVGRHWIRTTLEKAVGDE